MDRPTCTHGLLHGGLTCGLNEEGVENQSPGHEGDTRRALTSETPTLRLAIPLL